MKEKEKAAADLHAVQAKNTDLIAGYMYGQAAADYLCSTERKLSLLRRYGLIKAVKLGKAYVYKTAWLDEFMETWAGYDLSNEEAIRLAIREKNWRKEHSERTGKGRTA